MISLNLSPETKFGSIISKNKDYVVVRDVNNSEFKLTPSKFLAFCQKEGIAITKADKLFLQNKKGIFPTITERFWRVRQDYKKQWDVARATQSKLDKNSEEYKGLNAEVERLWIQQLTYKILINRIYGYFGNKSSPMGDPDIARSITLTGQGVIKKSNEVLRKYIKDKTGMTDQEIEKFDPVIYNDTDSVYITIKEIIKRNKVTFLKGKEVSPEVYTIVNDIESVLNKEIVDWAKNCLNSKDPWFKFKRESICDTGLFLQKKRYVLHKLDDEGLKCNKFKYTGVEVVRSTMPNPIKPLVKKLIET
jgi:DNA polymerase elongation subunit (family B)